MIDERFPTAAKGRRGNHKMPADRCAIELAFSGEVQRLG
jgi:hypothetical protein